mgnify:FL=1|jgi:hypothetical protein
MNRRDLLKNSMATVAAFSMASFSAVALAAAQNESQLRRRALRSLATSLAGKLLLPRDPQYRAAALSANARFDQVLPLAVAMCTSSSDVARCINWARKEGVALATKGGGHNYEGASSTAGLLINTRSMDRIRVDREAKTLVVGSGVLNGAILNELKTGNLMLPIGTCPQVGVCGLTLGGGIGENSRWAGMTCDRLRSTRLVLANGEAVNASDRENSDLFWACRGAGGGNFGIHTELVFELVPLVSPVTSIVELVYQGRDAAIEVFQAVDQLMQKPPNGLSGFMFVSTSPTLGDRPGEDVATGKALDPKRFPGTLVQLNYQGSKQELARLIEPLLKIARSARVDSPGELVFEQPFWEAQLTSLAVPDQEPHGFSSASRFANKPLSLGTVKELVNRLLEAPFAQRERNASVELMCWGGGVINEVKPDAMAYVHRNSTTIARVSTWWTAATAVAEQKQMLDWMTGTYDLIKDDCQNESFQNFPNPLVTDWKTAYHGQNLQKLVNIKQRMDPQNVFRHAQSIPLSV